MANYVQRVRRGTSPGDGVFVPVSPVCSLTRPNRMTVSPGTRAGRRACRRNAHVLNAGDASLCLRVWHRALRARRCARSVHPPSPAARWLPVSGPRASGCIKVLTPGDAGPEATPPRHGPERKARLAEDQGAEAMSTACGEEHTREGTPGVSEAQRCPSQGDVP